MSGPVSVSNSSSSSLNSSTTYVEGYRFQISVSGRGTIGCDTNVIYIPSMNLEIFEKDGSALRQSESSTSFKVDQAIKKYFKTIDEGKNKFDPIELKKISEQAQKESQEKVKIPFELAKEINDLVEKKLAIEAAKKEIDVSTALLGKKVFGQIGS